MFFKKNFFRPKILEKPLFLAIFVLAPGETLGEPGIFDPSTAVRGDTARIYVKKNYCANCVTIKTANYSFTM